MSKIITFFCFLCFSGVFAQSRAIISGNVKSSENENLIGVNISFISKDSQNFSSTDAFGNFSVNIPLGQIKIKVNQSGYLSQDFEIDLKKDTLLSIVLGKDVSQLKEVVIANDKKSAVKDLSGGKLSFNVKELSAVPSILETTDILKMFQLTP